MRLMNLLSGVLFTAACLLLELFLLSHFGKIHSLEFSPSLRADFFLFPL